MSESTKSLAKTIKAARLNYAATGTKQTELELNVLLEHQRQLYAKRRAAVEHRRRDLRDSILAQVYA